MDPSFPPAPVDSPRCTKSLIIQEADASDRDPAQRLFFALGELFARRMPGVAPRRGKGLDTPWGEFGILLATYFVPVMSGMALAAPLRDAWGRTDESIPYFVYGNASEDRTLLERDCHKLMGDKIEVASNSILGDRQRKDLPQRLDIVLTCEARPSASLSRRSVRAGRADEPLCSGGASLV
ncbi:MAG TPA: hypothetical protein VLZ89_08465 [Anaerolineales bacterium]|nr:hypothetical protein [Anaerolineales bacterium]